MGEPAADNREVGAPWEVRLALPEDRPSVSVSVSGQSLLSFTSKPQLAESRLLDTLSCYFLSSYSSFPAPHPSHPTEGQLLTSLIFLVFSYPP